MFLPYFPSPFLIQVLVKQRVQDLEQGLKGLGIQEDLRALLQEGQVSIATVGDHRYVLSLVWIPFLANNLLYIEPHHLAGLQQKFIPLENNPHLEVELQAQLTIAQAHLELEIMAYSVLKSKYEAIIGHPDEVAK